MIKTIDKKRGLGRGLSALFEDDEDFMPVMPAGSTAAESGAQGQGAGRRLAGVDQLEPGRFQPRQHIAPEKLTELAESIAVHGVLQPILVRAKDGQPERFEIIAGERRWRAAQKAQLHEVPVIIKELSDAQAFEIALIENLQRADLNALEEAQGFQKLADEFGHTQEKLAEVLGKSRSYIANALRLLTLPPSVQTLLRDGKLAAGHARALVTASNAEALARDIVARHLSVRDTERLVAAGHDGKGKRKKSGAGTVVAAGPKDIDTLALENHVSGVLGMKVSINMGMDAKGQVLIDVRSLDQLDDVLRRLSRA